MKQCERGREGRGEKKSRTFKRWRKLWKRMNKNWNNMREEEKRGGKVVRGRKQNQEIINRLINKIGWVKWRKMHIKG